jgi:hypothetical protein
MKSLRLMCLALVSMLIVSSADAALLKFGIHGNITNVNIGGPASFGGQDFSSQLEKIYGLGYGGGVHFDVSLPLLSFRLSGDYVRLSPDVAQFKTIAEQLLMQPLPGLTVEGGVINVIFGEANLKFSLLPLPVVSVYLTGGVGIVNIDRDAATVKLPPLSYTLPKDSETKASLNAGAGVDLGPLFGEARVTWILTEGKTTVMVPIGTVGITF